MYARTLFLFYTMENGFGLRAHVINVSVVLLVATRLRLAAVKAIVYSSDISVV